MLSRLTITLTLLAALLAASARAGEPLHDRIDKAIDAKTKRPVAARTGDEEFVRRVYLDFAGRIPSAAEAQAFLQDGDQGKRTKLIDRLLADPEFARRLRDVISVRLLERRPGQAVPEADWNAYIEKSVAANTPWNVLVRDLIAADGRDAKHRPAIRFFAEGNRTDAHQLTRDVGRIFLGMNLNCSQCHDDPNVANYKQADYFGVYAYLRQTQVKLDKDQRPFLVESVAAEKQDFQSVFTGVKMSTGPLLPGGSEVSIPKFEKGKEFDAPAGNGLPGTPKFRPRELLARHLTESPRFARASANYFWFVMTGRGLVHPLDMIHDANPASHPELLDALAAEFAEKNYDVRHLLREIALSNAYQRSSILPEGVAADTVDAASYRVAIPRPLSAEQLAFSAMQATGQLERILVTPSKNAKFTFKDYTNGRLPPPDSVPEILEVFSGTFGSPPGTAEVEFMPSTSQALFLMNDKLVTKWLDPREPGLVADLVKQADDARVTDEVYFRVLSRKPTRDEAALATSYLKKHGARRPEAVSELAWALLTSSEFRFNH